MIEQETGERMVNQLSEMLGQEWLAVEFIGNTVLQYIVFAVLFVLIFLLLRFFKTTLIYRMKQYAARTKLPYDDLVVEVLDTIDGPFYTAISLYFASYVLILPDIARETLYYVIVILAVMYAARAVQKVVVFIVNQFIERKDTDRMVDRQVRSFVDTIASVVIWTLAVLIVLQNVGFNVTTLLGGLGIAGLAVGIALQNILGDIFAYISIFVDKPFKVGDFIIVGTDMGTVEHVGVKTTRIKTLQGQELIMTNKELTEARVNNYKRMERRRIVFSIGVVYETPPAKLKKIPEMITQIIDTVDDATCNRVHFAQYGDFSLNFEVVYYVESPDYNYYMDIQQKINFAIFERFAKEKIIFAYPTQMVYTQKAE